MPTPSPKCRRRSNTDPAWTSPERIVAGGECLDPVGIERGAGVPMAVSLLPRHYGLRRELIDLVLESEVGALEGRRYESRLRLAGLPHRKTLDEFDTAFQPELDPKGSPSFGRFASWSARSRL